MYCIAVIIILAAMFADRPKAIFFDLDDTLFDHTRSERTSLRLVYRSLPDHFNGIAENDFVTVYDRINKRLWQDMANGKINGGQLRVARFQITMEQLGLHHENPELLSSEYLRHYAQQSFALPGARETLDYMKEKYTLGILSNGFPEIQESKLDRLDLQNYFTIKVFSEAVGAFKPHPEIFRAAEKLANFSCKEILYIGDVFESDVLGASACDWRTIWFNPRGKAQPENSQQTYPEIAALRELKTLL